jgi:aclacinomycin oxidase
LLIVHRKQLGKIIIRGLTTDAAAAEQLVDEYLSWIAEGVKAPQNRELTRMTWLEFALNPFPDLFTMPPGGVSMKGKDALLRRRLTDRQIDVVYDYMTRSDYDVMGGMFGLATYGARINAVAPDATASCHRGSIFDGACNTGWIDPVDTEKNLTWVRAFYRELFSDTGGVPVPGDAYDGCMINHPDVDLADPALNTSGVAWPTFYYREHYPRLQRIKARWDPLNVFHHALSIRADRDTA